MEIKSMLQRLPVHESMANFPAGSGISLLTTTQIERLVKLKSHRMINTVHHSAHNNETATDSGSNMTTWNIELSYPSGYTEHFTFPGLTKTGIKSTRSTEVFQDIMHTVKMIMKCSTCPKQICDNLSIRLEAAWKMNSFDLFKTTIGEVNRRIQETSLPSLDHLSSELVHHFFEQLYDRAVSPYSKKLNNSRAAFTYGELQPVLLSKIFQQVGLKQQSVYLDLGSGIGNTVMQAALETGCEAHGIEIEHYAHLVSVNHLQQFHARAVLWDLEPGQVQLYFGNFLHSPLIDDLLSAVDVVLVNNLKFKPTTDEQLRTLLGFQLKVGAKIVSTKVLFPTDPVFQTETCRYEPGSVSWTNSVGLYFIATKQRAAC